VNSDFRFDLQQVRGAQRYNTARLSIINPLVGFGAGEEGHKIPVAMARIQALWRARATELFQAGWPQISTPRRLQFVRNCPPVGFLRGSETQFNPCKMPRVCPFCHARLNVEEPFERLETLLFGSTDPTDANGETKRPPPGVHLSAFRTTHYFGPGKDEVWGEAFLARVGGITRVRGKNQLGRLRVRIRTWRKADYTLANPLAGAVIHCVYPAPARQKVVLVRGGVVLTTRPVTPDAFRSSLRAAAGNKDLRTFLRNYEYPTKKALRDAFLFAASYPAALMTCPCDDLIPLLEGLRKRKDVPKSGLRLVEKHGPKTQKAFFTLIGADPSGCDE
jgi:hypothetical protein